MKKYKKQIFITGSLIVTLSLGIVLYNNNSNSQAKIGSNITSGVIDKENVSLTMNNSEIQSTNDLTSASNAKSLDIAGNSDHNVDTLNTLEETDNLKTSEDIKEEPKEISDEIKTEIGELIKKYYNSTTKLDNNILKINEGEDIKKIVDGILMKRNGIESYQDINTYIHRGISKDTYVVFISYNMKFNNIETFAPGMSVLYIVTSENDGKLKIYNLENDEKLNKHIEELSKDEEIVKVIDKVNAELKTAIEKDKNLKKLVENLK